MYNHARARPAFDLKWTLVTRIVLVALLCVAGGVLFTLRDVATEAADQNREAAAFVQQQLTTQLFRIATSLDRADRFPDWDTIANYELRPGQCVSYILPDGTQKNAICVGTYPDDLSVPRWFIRAFDFLFLDTSTITRPLISRGQARGIIKATVAPQAIAKRAWLEASRMLGLWLATVVALCILVYLVVGHALRPTNEILAGIARLSRGDLTCRLPPFRLHELDQISRVFNHLAATLQETTRERAELARLLVDAQERERAHIARDLHDDVSQRLTALSVAARFIRKLVSQSSPEAMHECDELVKMGSDTMRSLRETLIHLRPPEIDELGLVASLWGLIDSQNHAAGETLQIDFEHEGTFECLSPDTAAHVYRIVQEGLNNAKRHGDARCVLVRLSSVPREPETAAKIELTITDNGKGLEPNWFLSRSPTSGVGLIGIRERVFALNGEFFAGAGVGGGFELRISFLAPGSQSPLGLGRAF